MIIFLMSFWLLVVIVKNTFKSKPAQSPRKLIIKKKRRFETKFQAHFAIQYLSDSKSISYSMARQHSWNNKYNNVDQNNVFVINVSSLVEVSESQVVYSSGIHIWNINWPKSQRGFISTIGFIDSSTDILLMSPYLQRPWLLNPFVYGWDLISNKLTSSWDSYPPAINDIGRFKFKTAANSFQMCLDLDHGTLSFLVDGKFLGFAYDNLINKTLKPVIISSAKAKIQMRYRGNFNGRF